MVSRKNSSAFKKVGLIFVTLCMALLVAACGNKKVAVTEVSLGDVTELELYVGEYEVLEATVLPENATDKTVTWTTSNDRVATVRNGVVEAVGAGQATITVRSGDKTDTVAVTVTERTYEYTVTFDVNGGTAVPAQTVLEGEKAEEPEKPTREGYEFAGWFVNDEEFDFDTEITQNIEIYAKWNEIFDVTFEVNGGSAVAAAQVVNGKRVTKPIDPQKVGYTFGGWFTDANLTIPYDFLNPVIKDLKLYAKWNIITYTITFTGINKIQNVDHGQLATEPEVEEKEGFIFGGWFTDPAFTNEFDFEEPVTASATLYAKWDFDPEVYTEATLEIGGGEWSFSGVQMFFAGLDPIASHPVKFYNPNNTQYLDTYTTTLFLANPDAPKTAIAWCNIVGLKKNAAGLYVVDQVIPASGTTTDGSKFDYFLYAHDGYPAGYSFLGSLQVGQLVALEGFDVVGAKPGAINATIKVYAAGTSVDTSKCVVRVNQPLPTPTKAGFTFGGWYASSDFSGDRVTTISEATKLYAKWVNAYEVSFGEDAKAQIVTEGEKATVPTKPTKAGFYFRGWYADAEFKTLFDFNTPITKATTVYAKWDENIVVETDDVDYNALWNDTLETWYIKVTVEDEDLDAESVKSIKVLEEAGVALETPKVLTPDTDKVMWFGVSLVDSDVSFKKAGQYAYEVVRKDDSVFVFTFKYEPSKVKGLTEVVYAESNYEAVLNNEEGLYFIEVVAEGEDLDAESIKSIEVVKEAGEVLEEAKALTPNTDKVMWFSVANKEDKKLDLKEAGEYAFKVVRKDDSEYILKFNYKPNMVVGLHAELANVDYNAVWNDILGTYYIEVTPSVDLSAANVKSIKVLVEAGETLETPRELTPDTDTVMWFGVATGNGDLTFKALGKYKYEVVLKDDSKVEFEFYYNPELVRQIEYPVTFNANGGKVLGKDTIGTFAFIGEKIVAPLTPERTGYKFVGWYLGDKQFDFAKDTINGPTTLVAKWELYKVNYELNGGKMFPFETKQQMLDEFFQDFYNYCKGTNTEFESLEVFKHGEGNTSGYNGTWYNTHLAKLRTAPRPTKADDSLNVFASSTQYYAKWLPFFDMMEKFVNGVNSAQHFYEASSTYVGNLRLQDYAKDHPSRPAALLALMPEAPAEISLDYATVLPVPVKDGYTFDGWYLTADFSGDPVTEIPVGTYHDVTVYAKWTAKPEA